MLTFDVRIWGIRTRNSKSVPFQLRWKVGDAIQGQPFPSKTLADGRHSELMSALRQGRTARHVNRGFPSLNFEPATHRPGTPTPAPTRS